MTSAEDCAAAISMARQAAAVNKAKEAKLAARERRVKEGENELERGQVDFVVMRAEEEERLMDWETKIRGEEERKRKLKEAKDNVVRVKDEGAKRVKAAREARKKREGPAKTAKLVKSFVGLNLGQ
ncbi:hypothetical protein LTR95_000635 [Oleoguttula sp. CCFEE 5521]